MAVSPSNPAASLADAVMPGTRIGPWIVEQKLAAGGSGSVYRARHARGRGVAAVKLLHTELQSSREAAARFAREVRVARRAAHPGLAQILGSGVLADGRPWFAMELLEGRDLAAVLLDRGAFTPEEALGVLAPLADALTAAHAHGVIHRDVKASNVFLADDGRVVLLDFGVAKLLDPEDGALTTSRHSVGTPSSMAPEQTAGGDVDGRTDVYGLGVLAFQLLTGELPFSDVSPAIMRQLHRWARRPRPSERAPVPAVLDAVVLRAMAREPSERHATPRELVDGLKAAIAEARSPGAPVSKTALAVWIEVRGDVAAKDVEHILPVAVAHLKALGWVPAVEMANAAAMVRPTDGPVATNVERRAGRDAAQAAWRATAEHVADAGRVRVHLDVRVAELAAGRVVGGDVMRLGDWIPDDDDDGEGVTIAPTAHDVRDATG